MATVSKFISLAASGITTAALTGTYAPSSYMMGHMTRLATESGTTFISTKPVAQLTVNEATDYTYTLTSPFCVDEYSDRYNMLVHGHTSAAATTRRIYCIRHDKYLSTLQMLGNITVTPTSGGNATVNDTIAKNHKYSSGTVQTTATSLVVTGSSTTWSADPRICTGSRIGFGSTNPDSISDWYTIVTITNDTSVTLDRLPPTCAAGTPYLIETLFIALAITNSVAGGGGPILIKGLSYDLFSDNGPSTPGNHSIPSATTVDRTRAAYRLNNLAGANTTDNQTAFAMAVSAYAGSAGHDLFVGDTSATPRLFCYNLTRSLTSVSGQTSSTFKYMTSTSNVISAPNRGAFKWAYPSSGPLSGSSIMLTPGSAKIQMLFTDIGELRGSGVNTYIGGMLQSLYTGLELGSGRISSVVFDRTSDMFFVNTQGMIIAVPASSNKLPGAWEPIAIMGGENNFTIFASAGNLMNIYSVYAPANLGVNTLNYADTRSGWLYSLYYVAPSGGGQIIAAIPAAADYRWQCVQNSSAGTIISPVITTPGATKLLNINVNYKKKVDFMSGYSMFSMPVNNLAVYARTIGISDNTGEWYQLDQLGDLRFLSPGSAIQFKFGFEVIADRCIMPQIESYSITYEDDNTDYRLTPVIGSTTVLSSRVFSWQLNETFSGSIPPLRLTMRNSTTRIPLLYDESTMNSAGVFEYSTNGTAWNAWNASAANVAGYYVRYTVSAAVPSGTTLRASLQVKQ